MTWSLFVQRYDLSTLTQKNLGRQQQKREKEKGPGGLCYKTLWTCDHSLVLSLKHLKFNSYNRTAYYEVYGNGSLSGNE